MGKCLVHKVGRGEGKCSVCSKLMADFDYSTESYHRDPSEIASDVYVPCTGKLDASVRRHDHTRQPVVCTRCSESNEYAVPNQPDGSFKCYGCRQPGVY